MKNTLRKALALLLCLGLCFSLLPLSALAEEPEAEEPPVEDLQPEEEPAEEPVEEPEEPAEEPGSFAGSEEELLSRQYGEDVIVGFESGEVPESIETEFKLFFGRVEEQLPETLTVYLGGSVYYTEDADGNETVRRIEGAKTDVLAVRWACVEDYNDELEVFHLRPVLEGCELADGVALPEVLLYIEGEFEIPPLTDIPYETEREIPIVGAAHADGARTSFPSAYSSYALGLLPPARNQGDYGTCWAHASIGCVEADLIHDGAVKADEIDLSELHLAYYAYHDYYDEKGCNEGDTIELHGNTGSTYLDFGGSRYVGARVLANQIGPVNESEVPYSLAYNYQPGTAQGRNTSGVQVVDTYWLDPGDTQGIKQAILDHGGIGMSLRYEAAYYNNATAAYYTTLTGTNHAVMLAGWDDDYPVENFRSDRERPSDPGAWLVRNSWGSRWGDHGYFWMSYEDKSFLSSNDVTILDAELLEYDHIYAYDGIPATDGWYYFRGSTSVSFHQYFPVSKGEQIEAIGFETADNALAVEITVTCGSETATVQTSADISGYYLVKLDKPIEVNTDDWADVAITFTGNQPWYLLEESWDYGDGPDNISFIASCGNPGGGLIVEGEVKNEDGLIKVFTNDIPVVTYPVSYDANGGSGAPAAQTKYHDILLTLSDTEPTRESSSLGSYKVTLDPNGGSVSPTSLTAARSVNYSFDSWNTDKNGSGTPYAPGGSYTANVPATLYAQWTEKPVTAAIELPTPEREDFFFLGWADDPNAKSGVYGSFIPESDGTLYAIWSDVPPGAPPESLTLSHEYILLEPDGTAQLSAVDLDPVWPLRWAASADGRVPEAPDDTLAISVSGSGLVSAQHQGTAYAVAYLTDRDGRVAVRSSCRVDVLAGAFKDSVKLTDTKATVELYSTAYTRLGILPVLSQNISHAQGVEGVSAGDSGFAIERAEFGRYDEAGEVFELRVVDDRTLEIVPKAEFVTTDAAKLKQVKGSYKNSSVTVYVEGEPYFAGLVTLTVKKTQPRVTARAGKLNSFLIEDTQSVSFSVPVASVRVDSTKANPGWLRFDADSSSIRYTGPNDVNQSGRLNLLVKPAGFALELPVAVTVSAGKTAPKLTLKPTTLNLQPGMGDLAVTEAAATLVSFDEWPLTPVSVLEGKNDASDALDVTINGSTVEVREGAGAPRDGKAHSYKLTLALERNGEPSPAQAALTVKLLASSAKPGLTAKASGAVDTAIPRSAVTVALTPKNINAGAVTVTELTVSGARGKAAAEDVTDRFDIEVDGLTVTLRQAEGAALEAGTTYTATVRTNVGAEASAKLTVKFSDPNKVRPGVTLKAAGAIDVIRPASSVTVTPTVKNCFTYVPAAGDLQIWQLVKRNGKTACDPADDKFDVCVENGVFVLKLKADSFVDHTADKFAVSFKATLDGTAVETGKTNITVKMGTAKLTQSVKAVNLSAHDRYSRGTVMITKEAGLRDIDWDRTLEAYVPPKDRDGNALLDILHLGGGEVAIFYAGSTIKNIKSATVKIPVFLVGNNSLKPNATVSVSVKAVQLF